MLKVKTCICGRRITTNCYFCLHGISEYEHYLINYGSINTGKRYQPPKKTLVNLDRQKIIRQLIKDNLWRKHFRNLDHLLSCG